MSTKYTLAKQKSKDMLLRKKRIAEHWQKWEDRYNDRVMTGQELDDIDCF